MVNSFRFLFCTLACFFSITTYASDLPANPRNDTPAQSLKRLQNNFKSQANYDAGMKRNLAEIDSRIYMNEGTKRASVEQMLTRSGVLESGAKAEVVAKVTQPVNNAKVASTLVDRLSKAKDYAKHAGKASIPAFLGGAAVQALVDGVGWVMDPKNNTISKKDDSVNVSDKFQSKMDDDALIYGDTEHELCSAYSKWWKTQPVNSPKEYYPFIAYNAVFRESGEILTCEYLYYQGVYRVYHSFKVAPNPNYQQPQPQTEVSNDELKQAFENALNSNNPALASAIAQAIKDAYSYDGSEGQDNSTNTAVIGAANDMNQAVDRAFDNPTSNSTSDKPSGYYKITDGEKTIEGYVTSSDTSTKTETETKTTTTTDPVTGNQTTTGTSTGSLQLPAFCSWAAIVCDWIGWTKEEPQEPELKPVFEEINVPYTPFSIAKFNAQCPPDENLSLNLMGQEMSFVFPMKPFCDFFSGIKPFVIALASFWAVKLIGNASFNSGN